ncbi:hypothetical protein [Modestobacter marinus]|nr:hypothetical protein [Modestobacter marinus]
MSVDVVRGVPTVTLQGHPVSVAMSVTVDPAPALQQMGRLWCMGI